MNTHLSLWYLSFECFSVNGDEDEDEQVQGVIGSFVKLRVCFVNIWGVVKWVSGDDVCVCVGSLVRRDIFVVVEDESTDFGYMFVCV